MNAQVPVTHENSNYGRRWATTILSDKISKEVPAASEQNDLRVETCLIVNIC